MKSKTKGLEIVLTPWGRIAVTEYHHMISYNDVYDKQTLKYKFRILMFVCWTLRLGVKGKYYGFFDIEKAHTSFEIRNSPPRT